MAIAVELLLLDDACHAYFKLTGDGARLRLHYLPGRLGFHLPGVDSRLTWAPRRLLLPCRHVVRPLVAADMRGPFVRARLPRNVAGRIAVAG